MAPVVHNFNLQEMATGINGMEIKSLSKKPNTTSTTYNDTNLPGNEGRPGSKPHQTIRDDEAGTRGDNGTSYLTRRRKKP